MSDPGQRAWRFYLADMIGFAEKVVAFTQGLDRAGFVSSRLHYDAALRNLELIGEAATHIPDSVRASIEQIPWRQIIATRSRLIHGYLGIDNDTLWSIIQDDIPALLAAPAPAARPAWLSLADQDLRRVLSPYPVSNGFRPAGRKPFDMKKKRAGSGRSM